MILGLLLACAAEKPAPIVDRSHAGLSPPLEAGAANARESTAIEPLSTIIGRVLDDQFKPIGNCKFVFAIDRFTDRSSWSGRPVEVTTDTAGHFLIVLEDFPPVEGEHRILKVNPPKYDEIDESSEVGRGKLEVTRMYTAGKNDCGDIVLVKPGSDTLLRRMDDIALEAAYNAIVSLQPSRWGAREREYEACLTEIARRSGDRWIAFLRSQLDQRRALDPEHGNLGLRPNELVLLTALRRAERKPDPLEIGLDIPPLVTATFPCLPIVKVRLKNVDPSESFAMTIGGGPDGSGRFERCRIDALDSLGASVAPWPSTPWQGSHLFGHSMIKPGEAFGLGIEPELPDFRPETTLDLNQFIVLPRPGEYSMRVQYHDQEDLAGKTGLAGMIFVISQPFILRFEPLKVRLSALELAEMRDWLAALRTERPLILVREHWSPSTIFEGEVTSAADYLFRKGWNALPVLMDALDDPQLTSQQRAWIVALLWNITGILNPESSPESRPNRALMPTNVRFINTWASRFEMPVRTTIEFEYPERDAWIVRLIEFSDRWRELRSCVELEIAD